MGNRLEQQQQQQQQREKILIRSKGIPKEEELLHKTSKNDEIILFFKRPDKKTEKEQEAEIEKVRQQLLASFREEQVYIDEKAIRRCSVDDPDLPYKYIELWKGSGIHTKINTEGVRSTTSSPVRTHGEQYFLNFFTDVPYEDIKREKKNLKLCPRPAAAAARAAANRKQEKVIVAVLDTGINRELVGEEYLWVNPDADKAGGSRRARHGWNFINDSPDIDDDSPGLHGTLVSQYIINEFANSPTNRVEIMTLKTHNKDGESDLFSIICAIHFAMAKGAKIINASWGFHYYHEFPDLYLKELITQKLSEKNILFFTPAGNMIERDNQIARDIAAQEKLPVPTDLELRNIEVHNFYPAVFSTDYTNVFTVTTTDGKAVSPTQNFSEVFVDLGIMADHIGTDSWKFRQPFGDDSPPTEDDYISGSSFATAIAAGRVGAFYSNGAFSKKEEVLRRLVKENGGSRQPVIFTSEAPDLKKDFIREGRYMAQPFKPYLANA